MPTLLSASPQRSFNLQLPQKVIDKLADSPESAKPVVQEEIKAEKYQENMI